MKKSSMLLIAAALVLSSCGTAAKFASSDNGQKFQDGIYNNSPSFRSKAEKAEDQAKTEALIEKTKASEIYLLGEKKDTIMVPENFSATIKYDQKLGGTIITVGENPYDWRFDLENNYGYYYGPYSVGASWYWSRHYDPWYWNTWSYSPWRYNSWYYNTWYYNSWYDPWYYGGAWGFYNPWYYGGFYGGWNPYYPHYPGYFHPGHHHGPVHGPAHHPVGPNDKNHFRGQRYQTGSQRLASRSTSLRGGAGVRSTTSRSSAAVSTSGSTRPTGTTAVNRGTVTRTTATNRTTATRVTGNTPSKSAAAKPATTVTRSAPAGYRKPTTSKSTATESDNTVSKSSAPSSSSSSSRSNSSSYQRSSTPSYSGRSAPSSRSTTPSSMGGFSRGSGSPSVNRSSTSGYRR